MIRPNENMTTAPSRPDPALVDRIEAKLDGAKAQRESTAKRQAVYRLPLEELVPVLRDLIGSEGGRLATITGIDVRDGTELLYHVAFDAGGYVATLKILVGRATDTMESITPWLPGAEFIERELHDMLGVNFTGHPRMERLLLSDDWPEGVYPLRRGFKKEDGRVQARHTPPAAKSRRDSQGVPAEEE